ncbi:hypothetical protein Aperf_G00000112413 [Anoplocephala perfoliata]
MSTRISRGNFGSRGGSLLEVKKILPGTQSKAPAKAPRPPPRSSGKMRIPAPAKVSKVIQPPLVQPRKGRDSKVPLDGESEKKAKKKSPVIASTSSAKAREGESDVTTTKKKVRFILPLSSTSQMIWPFMQPRLVERCKEPESNVALRGDLVDADSMIEEVERRKRGFAEEERASFILQLRICQHSKSAVKNKGLWVSKEMELDVMANHSSLTIQFND